MMKPVLLVTLLALLAGCTQRSPLITSPGDKSVLESPSEDTSSIDQRVFEVWWNRGEDSFNIKVVIHQKADNLISLAAFKSGRRLLTVWKVEERVWVYFPREKKVFSGRSSEEVLFFPEWPRFSFDEWVQILSGTHASVRKKNDHQFFIETMDGSELKWELKKQKTLESVAPIVFEPVFTPDTEHLRLSELTNRLEVQR